MAINPAIAALLQQKLADQAGVPAPGAPDPMAPAGMGIDPASAALAGPSFPSTDPNAVAGLLSPLEQAQQADQMALTDQQAQATQLAMQDMMSKLASRPNPDAWAATGGPGSPVSAPVAPTQDATSGLAY